MTHQTRRGPPPLECPLASLGRSNSPPLDSQTYLHPLSTSPLNPQVYQMSRKSPILRMKNDNIMYRSTTPSITNRPTPAERTIQSEITDAYHLSRNSSNSLDQPFKLSRNIKQPPTKYRPIPSSRVYTPIDNLLQYRSHHRTTTPSAYLLNDANNTAEEDDSDNIVVINHNEQYFLEEKMDSLYIQGAIRGLPLGSEMNQYKTNERYFLEGSLNDLCDYNRNGRINGTITPHLLQRPSSPSETSGSDRYLIDRARGSPAFINKSRKTFNSNGPIMDKRFALSNVQCFTEGLSNFGRFSPNLDQGYATLVSPSPTSNQQHQQLLPEQQQQQPSPHATITATTNIGPWNKKGPWRSGPVFDRLPDDAILKVFSWLDSSELCNVARVCRRFETIAWQSNLWKFISLLGEHVSGDKALKMIFRRLCGQSRNGACPDIERVMLSNGCRVSDKGLQLLARRCPELTHLQIQSSVNVSNQAMCDVLTKCTNLQHLDVTGCVQINSISVNSSLEPPRRLLLQYLDLTDCIAIDDSGLKVIVRNCPQLVFLYLRRCVQITDAGLKFVPSFCIALKELSVSDCTNITDFGLYELAKLGAALRYLSVAKCDRVSDAGLKVIARRCYKLRYLNARGCEAVSDDSITVLARSCPRLRALDIGKCDVSDAGLRALAESCPNLKKLSLRNCDMITDRGVQCIAYYCRGLQQLNIQDCSISLEGYRAVKKYCKRCVIEHTNPGFC